MNHAQTIGDMAVIRGKRNKKAAAIKRITTQWKTQRGEAVIRHLMEDLKLTGNGCLAHLAKILESQTVERAVENINQRLMERNETEVGTKGKLRNKSLIAADIKRACEFVNTNINHLANTPLAPLDLGKCELLALRIGLLGLLEVDDGKHAQLLTFEDDVRHDLGSSTVQYRFSRQRERDEIASQGTNTRNTGQLPEPSRDLQTNNFRGDSASILDARDGQAGQAAHIGGERMLGPSHDLVAIANTTTTDTRDGQAGQAAHIGGAERMLGPSHDLAITNNSSIPNTRDGQVGERGSNTSHHSTPSTMSVPPT